jgi:acetoin utilization deacetylase AcuC-like enzyme/GNAT superfamily N-acetyltransferase
MFKFVRVMAGIDPSFDKHLKGVKEVFIKAFPFNSEYLLKIDAYTQGIYPPETECIVLAAVDGKDNVCGFTLTFFFAKIKVVYLDYIASDPGRASRGIGGALYETAKDDAIKRGAKHFFLDALPDEVGPNMDESLVKDNKKRMGFYERLGARPIIGTSYEHTITPANLGDPNCLLYDNLGNPSPLSKRILKSTISSILYSKCGLNADKEPLSSLLESVTDDPVKIRSPKYPTEILRHKIKFSQAIDLVETGTSNNINHSPFKGYYERPARVVAITKALENIPLNRHEIVDFGIKAILEIHDERMVNFLIESKTRVAPNQIIYPEIFPIRHSDRLPKNWAMRAGYFCIDTSTPITNTVYDAAMNAANAAMTAAKVLKEQNKKLVYVAGRPPGHHAEKRVFGGFCYFNNAALAAHQLSKGGKRVAVLDVDHHHGNGTQDIFYDRADVLTISIHGNPEFSYPFYAGFEDEKGTAAGLGYNRNYPLPEGTDDAIYIKTLHKALAKIVEFKPDYLVVSLGVDIMQGDPTGAFLLTAKGMQKIGEAIGQLQVPTVTIQEGGYHIKNIRHGVRGYIIGLESTLIRA